MRTKKLYLGIALLPLLLAIESMYGQLANDDIYVEFGVRQWQAFVYEDYSNILSENVAEPVINARLEFSPENVSLSLCQQLETFNFGIPEFSFALADNFSGGEIGPVSFESTFSFFIQGFEHDPGDNDDNCVYESGDQAYVNDIASNQPTSNTMPSLSAPGFWYETYVDQDEFLEVSDVFAEIMQVEAPAIYSVKPVLYWSYAHGNSFEDPLAFTPMGNSEVRTHNNRLALSPEGVIGQNSQYTNTGGTFGTRDVFYSIEILENSDVTFSTNSSDFNTYITLYSSDGQELAQNDDQSEDINTSYIQELLCPGTYILCIEGAGPFAQGDINLAVFADPPSDFLSNVTETPASCANGENGSAIITVTGGIPPYQSQEWNNGTSGLNLDNVNPGSYTLTTTDACGTEYETNAIILNSDFDDPTCISTTIDVELEQDNGNQLTVSAISEALQFDDNCGSEYLSYDTSILEFTASDVGDNFYDITGTDENMNTATCSLVVSVSILNGIEESDKDDWLNIYPIPSRDFIYIETSLFNGQELMLSIFDINGKMVSNERITPASQGVFSISIDELGQGAYNLHLQNESGSVNQKFVKM